MYIYRETFQIITFLRVLFLTLTCLLETRLNSNIILVLSCNYTKKLTHCLKPHTVHSLSDTIGWFREKINQLSKKFDRIL